MYINLKDLSIRRVTVEKTEERNGVSKEENKRIKRHNLLLNKPD